MGEPSHGKIFNPNIRKLDPKIESCYFIGYPQRDQKGFVSIVQIDIQNLEKQDMLFFRG